MSIKIKAARHKNIETEIKIKTPFLKNMLTVKISESVTRKISAKVEASALMLFLTSQLFRLSDLVLCPADAEIFLPFAKTGFLLPVKPCFLPLKKGLRLTLFEWSSSG